MSEFICKKPITLSGRDFSYGEVIPDGFVLPGRALTLIRSNYIAEISGELPVPEAQMSNTHIQSENEDTLITIPISTENGILEATMSSQSVITALTIMQKNVEDAGTDIAELEDTDALLILNAVDSRKGIQKAAEERNTQLQKAGNDDVVEPGTDDGGTEKGDA